MNSLGLIMRQNSTGKHTFPLTNDKKRYFDNSLRSLLKEMFVMPK